MRLELVCWLAGVSLGEMSCEVCHGDPPMNELNPGPYVVDEADDDPSLLGSTVDLTEDRLVLTYVRDGKSRRVEYAIVNEIVD
jgi:hypothetical protein